MLIPRQTSNGAVVLDREGTKARKKGPVRVRRSAAEATESDLNSVENVDEVIEITTETRPVDNDERKT